MRRLRGYAAAAAAAAAACVGATPATADDVAGDSYAVGMRSYVFVDESRETPPCYPPFRRRRTNR